MNAYSSVMQRKLLIAWNKEANITAPSYCTVKPFKVKPTTTRKMQKKRLPRRL